jgi:hypothetical protein
MSKRILFCSLFILIFLIYSKQDLNAKTWPPGSKIPADSIEAVIRSGEELFIDSCEILDTLIITAWEEPKGSWVTLKDIWGLIRIVNSTFHDPVSFSYCCFHKDVYLEGNTFIEEARFDESTFAGLADFMDSRFKGHGSFFQVVLKGDAYFGRTSFDSTVSFSLEEFGNLYYLRWKQLDGQLVYDEYLTMSMYALARYFEERRQLDDADGVYLFLKNQERMEKPKLQRYLEYWFIQLTCGYGTRPLRALATSGLVMVLFAIFYYLIKIREPKKALGAGLRRIGMKAYNGIYFSVNTFVIGAPLEWTPEDTQSSTKHYLFRILTTVERTLGWILLVLFVVTLTRKFIR